MQRWAAILTLALASPAAANSLIVQVVPSLDPDDILYCALNTEGRQISAISAKGRGLQNPRPYRWWASAAEDEAILDGLAQFLTGDLASGDPTRLPFLQPPYLTIDWVARADGGLASGRYQQSGTSLPAPMRRLIETVMPGSYCTHTPLG